MAQFAQENDDADEPSGQAYSTVSGHTPDSLMRFFNPDCYTGFDDGSKVGRCGQLDES
jgi:hypothetical protein